MPSLLRQAASGISSDREQVLLAKAGHRCTSSSGLGYSSYRMVKRAWHGGVAMATTSRFTEQQISVEASPRGQSNTGRMQRVKLPGQGLPVAVDCFARSSPGSPAVLQWLSPLTLRSQSDYIHSTSATLTYFSNEIISVLASCP